MEHFKKPQVLILLVFLIISCHVKDDAVEIINLEQATDNMQELKLSQIANSIEYIPIESKKECLINRFASFYLIDTSIVCIAFDQILLFDRRNGKFIRQIGHHGKDPDGYQYEIRANSPFDEENGIIYTIDWDRSYKLYSLQNKVIGKITVPANTESMTRLNDSIYIAYIKNYSGDEKNRLIYFDRKGNTISKIPNYNRFIPVMGLVSSWGHGEGWFYKFQNKLKFHEALNDTLYTVDQKGIHAEFVINSGKYTIPYEDQSKIAYNRERNNYITIARMYESKNFIFFSYVYDNSGKNTGYYDKNDKTCFASKNGFINDLDNFIPFQESFSMYDDKYLIGYAQAYEIAAWFEANPELAKRLPDNLKKFKHIDPSDNPVVMLVKLKE